MIGKWFGSWNSERIVTLHEQQLFALAARYDLSDKRARELSVRVLSELFFELARLLKPDLFLEIGAKDADVSARARKLLPKSQVVAFEANPHVFEEHRVAARAAGVDYRHMAVNDRVGSATFNVLVGRNGKPMERTTGQGSLLSRTNPTSITEPETVATASLDSVFRGVPFETVGMWIDVEGAQREVLTGAASVLRKAAFLIIEVEDRGYWKGQWLRRDVVRSLYASGLIPVARDFQSNFQFNYIFVRTDAAENAEVRNSLSRFWSMAPSRPSGSLSRDSAKAQAK